MHGFTLHYCDTCNNTFDMFVERSDTVKTIQDARAVVWQRLSGIYTRAALRKMRVWF